MDFRLNIEADQTFRILLVFLWGGFLLYFNTFFNTWSFDDYVVVLNNPDITSLHAFLENTYPGRPLREITMLLDYQIFGLNPVGWHIQNFLWHALNAWLVFHLAYGLSKKSSIAWTASLLFLVHPIQVEVVAQASHRKDSLAAFFVLLAIIIYRKVIESERGKWLLLGLTSILFFMACMAKLNALATPLILITYELAFVERSKRLLSKNLIVLGATLGVFGYLVLRVVSFEQFFGRISHQLIRNNYFGPVDLEVYFRTVIKSWGILFRKIFWPDDLAVNYLISPPSSWQDPVLFLTIFSLVIIVLVAALAISKKPLLGFAIFWTILFYLPTANLWPISWLIADRYLYLPSIGIFLAIAFFLERILHGPRLVVMVACLVICLSLLTYHQNQVWRSPETLAVQSYLINPNSARSLGAIAVSRYADEPHKSRDIHLQALALNSHEAIVHFNLGSIYEELGDTSKALEQYRKFLQYYNPVFDVVFKAKVVEAKKKLKNFREKVEGEVE